MTLKTFLLACCIFLLQLASFAQEKNYKIYGTAKGSYKGNVYLFFENNYKAKDSICSHIDNGKFYFEGKVRMPIMARLHLEGTSIISDFYLENTTTNITCVLGSHVTPKDTFNSIVIEDVERSKSFVIQKQLMDTLNKASRIGNNEGKQVYNILHDFISKNPDSRIGAYCLGNYAYSLPYNEVKELKNLLALSLQNTFEVATINKALASEEKKALRLPGLAFHDIVSKDTSGNTINTKDFRGKYLLVVCWATWCVPCRREHPALNALYEKYKSRGLEIIGVSVDAAGSEQKWKQAIIKDSLTWPQVSDLNGFNTDISNYYKLEGEGIPFNFLVDKDGKIIASKLQLSQMESIIDKKLSNQATATNLR
jgi:peroxiredoxin